MEKSNIWHFPKSHAVTRPWKRLCCVGATDRNSLGTDPTIPTPLQWWIAAPITSRIEEEIGPTLWKSKQHLSTVITILWSSLQPRTRVSLSYPSKAKAHCQVTGTWLGAPCCFPMGMFIFRCPTLEGGSSQPAAETVGLWNISSQISLLAVHYYFKSRITWSLVNTAMGTCLTLIKLRTTAPFRLTLSSLENNRKLSLSVCHHFPALHL